MPMIVTVLEAFVDPDRQRDLEVAYSDAIHDTKPAGLVRSSLLHATYDENLWRIETVWESREALEAMRRAGGTPRGLLIFRAAGAEPALSVFEVAAAL